MQQNEALVKSSVLKAMLYFAVPIFFAKLLQVLYSAAGLFILGNFSTTAEVAGASTASMIMSLVTLGLFGLTTGLMVVIGQYCGAGSEKDAAGTIGTGIVFFTAFSVVVTAILLVVADPVIRWMNTPASAVIPAKNYLMVSSIGVIFIVGYNVVGNICRGLGNSKAPLIFVAVACLINVGLNLLFIPVFGWGALGAALALIIAQGCSFFFSLIYLWKKGLGFKFTRHDIRFNTTYVKKLLKIGAPLSIQEMLVMLSFIFIAAVVNKMGETESAAIGIVEKLVSFLMMPSLAITAAVSTMSAHNFGANEYQRAKKCMWYGVFMSLALSFIFVALCWLDGEFFTALFSKDANVIYQGSLYLKSYILDCFFVSFVFIMNGYFASCNHSIFSMVHSLAATFLVRVPLTAFFAGRVGTTLFHMGLAAPISSLGSVIICLVFFRYLSKKQTQTLTSQ